MSKKTILVCGANGMLAKDFIPVAKEQGFEIIAADRNTLDVTDFAKVKSFFEQNSFDYVLNAAAYTEVDKAEEDIEKAFSVNEKGAGNLAIACREKNIPLVYISTDYVFGGDGKKPYETSDKPNPQGVYAQSKLSGEIAVKELCEKHYILRTSWLYGKHGKNFVETMLTLSEKRSELKVVDDQKGCPTWTVDLSNVILDVLKSNKPYGIYHACSSGEVTWYGFAKKVFELAKRGVKVIPCSTEEFPRPAKRPKYSVMNNQGLMGPWEKGLEEYLKRR